MRITTVTDLKTYLDTVLGSESNDTIRDTVADHIRHDPNRPNWGTNWAEYLDTLDLWKIATQPTA